MNHRGWRWWIIVMRLKILLIMHFLIWEILVEGVLNVHVRGVRIKKKIDLDIVMIHVLQKEFIEKYLCCYAHGEP
jgi:hypothetical protein